MYSTCRDDSSLSKKALEDFDQAETFSPIISLEIRWNVVRSARFEQNFRRSRRGRKSRFFFDESFRSIDRSSSIRNVVIFHRVDDSFDEIIVWLEFVLSWSSLSMKIFCIVFDSTWAWAKENRGEERRREKQRAEKKKPDRRKERRRKRFSSRTSFLFSLEDESMSVEREIPSSSTIYGFDSRIVRFGSIFLFVVGTFGNLVSFVIFSDVSLRRSSTFRYLALLSLMDLVVLYSGLLDLFLMVEYSGVISLRNINIVTCRLHTFVTYWSQHSSSWILCFISVDRAVATNFITFARKFCTPRSAELIVLSILIFIGLLNSHELIFLDLQETKTDEIHFNEKILPRNSSSTMIDFAPTKIGSTNQQIFDNKSILRQCQATENGQYGFFWDHVNRDEQKRAVSTRTRKFSFLFRCGNGSTFVFTP